MCDLNYNIHDELYTFNFEISRLCSYQIAISPVIHAYPFHLGRIQVTCAYADVNFAVLRHPDRKIVLRNVVFLRHKKSRGIEINQIDS